MLGGRNTEPNTPGSGSSRPAMRVNASRAAPLRLGAVLLCLFYFVSSINDEAPGTREAERHSDLPGGKALASGHRCPPPIHPPTLLSQRGRPVMDPGRSVHVCGQNKTASFSAFAVAFCGFEALNSPSISNVLVIFQLKGRCRGGALI